MRFLPLVALTVPLSGCILPPVLVVASYAGDAVLAVTTEKTSTDHLLSMAEKKDCAMWRVVKGRPICHDFEDGHGPYEKWRDTDGNQVATAGSDAGFTTITAKDSRSDVDSGQLAAVHRYQQKGGVLLAQAGTDSPIVTAADAYRAKAPDRSVQSAPLGAPPPLPLNQSVDNAPTVNDGAPVTQTIPPATLKLDGKPTATKVAPADAAQKQTVSAGRNSYVVVGSYRQQDNAQRVMREHRDIKPVMQSVTVKNERYYRVVAGPYTASQAAEIRGSLKAKSHIEATVARNCDAKSRVNCIDING